MVLPSKEKVLTLYLNPPIDKTVSMQYHPSALGMSERTAARNSPGLNNIITYIPPKNTSDGAINITAYFTALIPERDSDPLKSSVNADLVIGAGLTGLAAAASFGGRKVLDILDATTGTISLAKGIYDLGAGVIAPKRINPLPRAALSDQFQKVVDLSQAMKESVPVDVQWDLAMDINPNNKYIINSLDIDVEDIHEETADSFIIEVSLVLIKQGVRVHVINGGS